MTYDDDILMAYADGELDPELRTRIASALQADPELAARVASHQLLRRDVFAAYAGTLDEPVPQRLRQVEAAAPAGARVVDLGAARMARQTAAQPAGRRPAWSQWGAMAAMLVVGVLAGSLGAGWLGAGQELAVARSADGQLTAGGDLAQALDRRLAGAADASGVRVGLSFRSTAGTYCRTFQLGASAGLACRERGAWRVPILAQAAPQAGTYRQASAALPPAVMDAVDARIAGSTLDAAAERTARDLRWESAAPGR
jgi:hypothetical protein